jgi:hypothetical protein
MAPVQCGKAMITINSYTNFPVGIDYGQVILRGTSLLFLKSKPYKNNISRDINASNLFGFQSTPNKSRV